MNWHAILKENKRMAIYLGYLLFSLVYLFISLSSLLCCFFCFFASLLFCCLLLCCFCFSASLFFCSSVFGLTWLASFVVLLDYKCCYNYMKNRTSSTNNKSSKYKKNNENNKRNKSNKNCRRKTNNYNGNHAPSSCFYFVVVCFRLCPCFGFFALV